MSFDFRAQTLLAPIDDDWEPDIRNQAIRNREAIKEQLVHEYGAMGFEAKIQNFADLGVAPLSVVSIHNELLDQSRRAFVAGAYYPALVGVCALGERILNAIILRLRDKYFADHEATKYVRKQTIDNWTKAIQTLEAWGVFSADTVHHFNKLASLRHRSVHYQMPQLHETGGRAEALQAIALMQAIISSVFEAYGAGDRFIPNTPGVSFIHRAAEERPLVKEFYLPACVLVSPEHEYVNFAQPEMQVLDNSEFAEDHGVTSLSDEDFASWNSSPRSR